MKTTIFQSLIKKTVLIYMFFVHFIWAGGMFSIVDFKPAIDNFVVENVIDS